ncbi:MAG: polymer-forming cytoskeletal protein [Pseudomonadota bacterium]
MPYEPGGDMFRSRFGKSKSDAVTGFLGSRTEFTGKLSFSGTVHLDGHFQGEIISRGTLVVGGESVVHAQIQAAVLKIAGEVRGDLTATERIEIFPPAKVYGSIRTPCLVVEEGGFFEGTCFMSSVKEIIPALAEPTPGDVTDEESIEAISAEPWPPAYGEEIALEDDLPVEPSQPKAR